MSFEDLKELLAEQFSCDCSDLEQSTTFAELGADHEDFIELSWEIGEAIGVEIDENTTAQCETVGELFHMIRTLEEENS